MMEHIVKKYPLWIGWVHVMTRSLACWIVVLLIFASKGSAQNEILNVKVVPSSFDGGAPPDSVCFVVENHSRDTVAVLNGPVLVEGDLLGEPLHSWPGMRSTVHILYYETNKRKLEFHGDGEYENNFTTWPALTLLVPHKTLKIQVPLPDTLKKAMKGLQQVSMWAIVSYGMKREIDSVLKVHADIFRNQKTGYSRGQTINTDAILRENFKPPRKSNTLLELIWECLHGKAASPRRR